MCHRKCSSEFNLATPISAEKYSAKVRSASKSAVLSLFLSLHKQRKEIQKEGGRNKIFLLFDLDVCHFLCLETKKVTKPACRQARKIQGKK
jgi:hypothetical protein